MKIRNIVFSGFMASILMAGGAYAVAPTLVTQDYADSIASYAKGLVDTEASTARAAEQANASAISEHTGNTTIHVTSGDKTAWDGAVSGLASEIIRATTAEDVLSNRATALETKVGDASVVSQISTALTNAGIGTGVANLGSRMTAAEEDIGALEATVGDSNSGLVKDVTTLKTEVEATTTGLLAKMAVVQGGATVDGSIAKALNDAKDYADSLADDYDVAGAAAAVQGDTNTTVKANEDAIAALAGTNVGSATVAGNAAAIAAITGCGENKFCYITATGPVSIETTGDTYTAPSTGGGSTGGNPTEG